MKPENVVGQILSEIENIQSIPSPTFHENNRGTYIFNAFLKRDIQSVEVDSIGNVIGFLPGSNSKDQIVVSAHLDTIHDFSIDHQIRKELTRWIAPGIGDNTISLAIILVLIDYFKEEPNLTAGGIWFVANVQEEGLGNLSGIKQIVDRFTNSVRAYLVLEGIGLGTIYHRGLGVKRYQLEVQTRGGHAWGDFGRKSAINELVSMMNKLMQLDIPKSPRYSFNFGEISGGVSINSIANYAECKFEFRSIEKNQLLIIERMINKIIKSNLDPDVVYSLKGIGERPFGEIPEKHWLVQLAIESLNQSGVKPNLSIGSTDANYPLSLGYPAICICLARGGNVHTINEFIEPSSIILGFMQIQSIIKKIWINDLN
jgi:acetylornithine deacetylase/succinyl-diaminopimelate desuccinylase-like protein